MSRKRAILANSAGPHDGAAFANSFARKRLEMKFIFLGVIFSISWAHAGRVPQKYLDRDLQIPAEPRALFAPAQIATRSFVKEKNREWRLCHQPKGPSILKTDETEDIGPFMENTVPVVRLEDMERARLREGEVSRRPWSGDYWPVSRGMLGNRFGDQEFLFLPDWLSRSVYIRRHPVADLLRRGPSEMKKLSTSEKYDLLIGDKAGVLTQKMWDEGRNYYEADGQVEEWMGLCHGWAPAAIYEPLPASAVTAESPDQRLRIKFLPSEIKGLLSFSWATNRFDIHFLGSRCDKKDPLRDENGRLLEPECFDINPATWHKLIVNRIGVLRKSFIIDATFDYQVWNQPVFAYSYKYYDPVTSEESDTLASAVRSYEDFRSTDRFAKYRSPRTRSIVGISMGVGYIAEMGVNVLEVDNSEGHAIWAGYRYDLELDENGEVVGGEWENEFHPDFVWAPKTGAWPQAPGEYSLAPTAWNAQDPLPRRWRETAIAASRAGRVLELIGHVLAVKSDRQWRGEPYSPQMNGGKD